MSHQTFKIRAMTLRRAEIVYRKARFREMAFETPIVPRELKQNSLED